MEHQKKIKKVSFYMTPRILGSHDQKIRSRVKQKLCIDVCVIATDKQFCCRSTPYISHETNSFNEFCSDNEKDKEMMIKDMFPNRYTYHSRKCQGFRQNVVIGPRGIFQMKHMTGLKPTDLNKIEAFIELNGSNVVVEWIEKDSDNRANITVWTNKHAFDI